VCSDAYVANILKEEYSYFKVVHADAELTETVSRWFRQTKLDDELRLSVDPSQNGASEKQSAAAASQFPGTQYIVSAFNSETVPPWCADGPAWCAGVLLSTVTRFD
jgi:hypothetical protein